MTSYAYQTMHTTQEILAKEQEILNKHERKLTVPTQYAVPVRFLKAAYCDKELKNTYKKLTNKNLV